MKRVALLLAAVSRLAAAQTGFELEQSWLDPAARGSVLVGNGQTLPGGDFRVGTALGYSHGQLQSRTDTLLRDRFVLHLLGAVGITRWLEFGADLPVLLDQTSEAAAFAPSRSGLATPFLQVKVAILDRRQSVALSAALGLGLPVGNPAALGNGGLLWAPRLNLGRTFDAFVLGVELGLLIRPTTVQLDANTSLGSQLYLSAAVTGIGDGIRGEVSARAYVSFTQAQPGLELLAGVRLPLKSFELFALAGPGIGGVPSTPNVRLVLGVAFGNTGPPHGRCDPRDDYLIAECPDLDKDGDGVKNGVDLAPLLPEDKDGFEDEDGRPDPDNDLDGILDGDDRCPNQPGPAANFGCPDLDTDGDGVLDSIDACPNQPGPGSEKGCPVSE